jgi:hypothetical protein
MVRVYAFGFAVACKGLDLGAFDAAVDCTVYDTPGAVPELGLRRGMLGWVVANTLVVVLLAVVFLDLDIGGIYASAMEKNRDTAIDRAEKGEVVALFELAGSSEPPAP